MYTTEGHCGSVAIENGPLIIVTPPPLPHTPPPPPPHPPGHIKQTSKTKNVHFFPFINYIDFAIENVFLV